MKYLLTLGLCTLLLACHSGREVRSVRLFPVPGAVDVNPDTRLTIEFTATPVLGVSGKIRIFEAGTGLLVDSLDLSIPAGPTRPAPRVEGATYTKMPYDYARTKIPTNRNTRPGTPSGTAEPTSDTCQLTIIGGFTDGFHFHPVLVQGSRAVICPHHQMLERGKRYYVTIDKGVLSCAKDRFDGIADPRAWSFTTKAALPALRDTLVVSADGTGDFSTVQGAMDFIPDFTEEPVVVFVRNGDYEELVYFRNKSNVTLEGESRDGVIIHYANNEVFNPHPRNVLTNEVPGTFPSRRAAFAMDNCRDMTLKNLTVMTTLKGQAEGLLVMGERNRFENIHIVGDGDALQVNGSAYFTGCRLDGGGDAILGRGPAFFYKCELNNGGGPFIWVRNTDANRGNVFVGCTFRNTAGRTSVLARSPKNSGKYYPYAEAVLIDCRLDGIAPEGWGRIEGDTRHNRFWEYNSIDAEGRPVDVSRRHPASRQLTLPGDKEWIEKYRNPEWVLGWNPEGKPEANR